MEAAAWRAGSWLRSPGAFKGAGPAALGFAEQGSVFVRDAEAALLSLRQSAEKEMRRLMDLRSCVVRLRCAAGSVKLASERVPEEGRSTLEALSAHASLSASLRDDLATFFHQRAAETNPDRFLGVLRHEIAGGLRLATLKVVERASGRRGVHGIRSRVQCTAHRRRRDRPS